MNTRTEVISWWTAYRCSPGRQVNVAFPGVDKTWWLPVAIPSKEAWQVFADVMADYDYLFRESKGGTYNCRNTATGVKSLHAYAIALDLNPSANPPGTHRNDYPDGFVESIESIRSVRNDQQVFRWGDLFADPMHWEINVSPTELSEGVTGGSMALSDADKQWIEKTIHDQVVHILGGDRELMRKVDPAEADRYGNRGVINSTWRTLISGQRSHDVVGETHKNTDRLVDELS